MSTEVFIPQRMHAAAQAEEESGRKLLRAAAKNWTKVRLRGREEGP
jgi:hypothetical protein